MWRYFFARFLVLYGVYPHRFHTGITLKFARESHRSLCGLQSWLGFWEVFTDELAIGSEDYLYIFMPKLASHVPRIGACGQ